MIFSALIDHFGQPFTILAHVDQLRHLIVHGKEAVDISNSRHFFVDIGRDTGANTDKAELG